MKCIKCGTEIPEGTNICPECQTIQPQPLTSEPPQKSSNGKKIIIAAAVIAAAGAAAVFGFTQLNAKDPKQTVIDAFKTTFSEDRVFPANEVFGTADLWEAAMTSSSEAGITLQLDSCSDETVNSMAGGAVRFSGKNDVENKKESANVALIYNAMDVVNVNAYFGDDTMMLSVPELTGTVFTLDLGDGLPDRVKNSPIVGPFLAENGVDIDGLAAFLEDYFEMDEDGSAADASSLDFDALITRYKEGCSAQENFEAALTVEKAEKGTFTIDGQEVSCKGYSVLVSKAAMIDFLRTSSDFFLQDETLKAEYLRQLQMSVQLGSLLGGMTFDGETLTAEELHADVYEQAKTACDEMIAYLDQAMTDLNLTVYVDKEGRLAALDGSTSLLIEGTETADVEFHAAFEGGAYSTQNMNGQLIVTADGTPVAIDFIKQGVYDEKQLTCDLSLGFTLGTGEETSKADVVYTGSYLIEGGDYHISLEVGVDGTQAFKTSVSGIIDQLEKGKSYRTDIDSIEVTLMDQSITLSGELYFQPLSGEIVAPEGTQMDVLAATENDWYGIMMEGMFSFLALASQLGIPLS